MKDDTLALLSSIKLLNKHLWGDEEEITIVDTYNLAMVNNRLNSFFRWEDRLETPKTFYQWKFWQFVCKRLEEEVREEVKRLLEQFPKRPEIGFLFWLFCIVVVWLFSSPCENQDNKPGGGILDPPTIFIPIPGIEIGGCARNDSLIAPAI
ncbi:hypothetical protein QUA82_34070 [Microcoleus sp. F8-D3]